MKKLILLLAIALIAVSCEGPMGPPGEPGEPGYANWTTFNVTIESYQWQLVNRNDGLGSFYMCDVDAPEIDDFIFKNGTVLAYIYADTKSRGYNPNFQTLLPMTMQLENAYDIWTETITFDYGKGSMAFYDTASNFSTIRPPKTVFRVVLLW